MLGRIAWTIAALAVLAAQSSESRCVAAYEFDAGVAVRATVDVVEQDHLVRQPVDDSLSQKWYAAFLARLDPRRMYFLQSDLQDFAPFEKRLDDLARKRSFEFATLVRERFQSRVAEAAKLAEVFVEAPHDFSIDEAAPRQFDEFAATADELRERWRQRIKLEMLIEKVYGRPTAEVRGQLTDRYRRILQQAREIGDERLAEIYLGSFLSLYDPDSRYDSPATVDSFSIQKSIRSYEMDVWFQEKNGRLLLRKSLWRKIPAVWHVLEGFELIAIRRPDGRVLDVVEMPADEVDRLIRWVGRPLEDEKEVILELMKPNTFERLAVRCRRSQARY
jgi:carboxyl-terminal processing protease